MYRDLELGDLETWGLGRAVRRTFTDFGLERGKGGRVEEELRRQRGGSDEWRRRRDARVACGRGLLGGWFSRRDGGARGTVGGMGFSQGGSGRMWLFFGGWEWADEGGSGG